MYQLALVFVGLLAAVSRINAECANACNGHGKCTSFDMCICNRNWQAADCSERVCQFGLAHVDTPKGDLDGSGDVSNANQVVVDNSYVYPYGTTEQFPQMQDTDLQTLSDTAHYYMECSNKGRCDRTTGECQCFEGYDGVACQRASCPGYPHSCSGHGVCKTIRQLANADYGNVYELWDKHSTMGCECDAGYTGPDCSERLCKHGVDPLYMDDAATIKFSTWDIGIMSTGEGHNFTSNIYDSVGDGYFAIRVYDSHGEDWLTGPIRHSANCPTVVNALESLPNNVIPKGTVLCTNTKFFKANGTETNFTTVDTFYDAQYNTGSHAVRLFYKMALWEAQTNLAFDELSPASDVTPFYSSFDNYNYEHGNTARIPSLAGNIYRLKMYGNPGKLRQPEVEVYLDGSMPTLVYQNKKVITKVWTDGQQGEDNDYFADHCAGVTVTVIKAGSGVSVLSGFTPTEKMQLKKCLGTSDFNTTNNVEVYNWDYGSMYYPHLIKLVRSVTTYTDGGYYAAIYYGAESSVDGEVDNTQDGTVFRLFNPFVAPDQLTTDNYDVYTTEGVLALTSEYAHASFGFGSRIIFTSANETYDLENRNNRFIVKQPFNGDISCEHAHKNAHWVHHCLNKSDIFTVLSFNNMKKNPPHINLYTAEKIYSRPPTHVSSDRFASGEFSAPNAAEKMAKLLSYGTHLINTDLSTNWAVAFPTTSAGTNADFYVYKFFPAQKSTYNYVNECSNRGICDRDSGVCKCFGGYTGDSCSEQSSLAL